VDARDKRGHDGYYYRDAKQIATFDRQFATT